MMSAPTSDLTSSTMFACEYTSRSNGIENNFRINTKVPSPELPTAGTTTVVKVLSASLNPQDYKVAEVPLLGRLSLPAPATPGTDFVGHVFKTTCPFLKEGDIVFGSLSVPERHGSLAEFVLVKETDSIAKVPREFLYAGIDLRQFACLGTAGLTAMQSFKGVQPGMHVFINGGSGGTGTFGIQISKRVSSCGRVVASCSARNAALVKSLGADEAINYRDGNLVEALKASATRAGEMFDVVIDNIGNNTELYWKSKDYLKPDGKYILIGAPALDFGFMLDVAKMSLWPRALGGPTALFEMMIVTKSKEGLDELAQYIIEGKLRAVIDQVYGIDDVSEAFDKLKSGKARGKLVVDVSSRHSSLS